MTFPALFFGVLLLLVWLCLFSRLPGRTRFRIFAVSVVVVAAGAGLFRIEGVSGNFVPIVSPRWSDARDFGGRTAAAGVTAPGPDDYPQFLGPRRDATLDGPRLARDWQSRPPRELWRHDVGEGWSSFAVVGQAAVTQELRGDDEVVVRYELTTGKTVWTHAYTAPFRRRPNPEFARWLRELPTASAALRACAPRLRTPAFPAPTRTPPAGLRPYRRRRGPLRR